MLKEKVILVGLCKSSLSKSDFADSMQELEMLADTADVDVAKTITQSLSKPVSATYIGKGKINELAELAEELEVKTIIFNDDLSPAQARNISDETKCNIVDRTELILDIFSKHAHTKQSKLQVELAQLEYSYSRLKNMWKHLSRIKGGIGFRGPGEKQIEVDRREIKYRTSIVKKRLADIEVIANTKRKKRVNHVSLSLVGYTNAGKSTLFNTLTKEDRYTANQLFATLDSKTRAMHIPHERHVVITDTIGFIKKLPHSLVSSFHTTLLEVTEADLLLHVVDASDHKLTSLIESVEKVLKEIGAAEKNTLMVFNKIDLLDTLEHKFIIKELKNKYPDAVFLSAVTGENIDELLARIEYFINKLEQSVELKIPHAMQDLMAYLRKNANVDKVEYTETEQIVSMRISSELYKSVSQQVDEWKMSKYINE